jgi:DNA-directed RNA polymerase subunit RPC12/RpoP
MTLSEFEAERTTRVCVHCGQPGMTTERNPNNNGLLVRCPHCGSKHPWGHLLYLKQNEGKRPSRPPLPNGETLDSIWAKFGDRCVVCTAPKHALIEWGIGRQVHHVAPYLEEGHRGPLVPICAHCHSVANDRQRLYWFFRNKAKLSTGTAAKEGGAKSAGLAAVSGL